VSALGHYLEEEGLATVVISLIRPQTENTKPPRAVWVPFELGRPFGPPSAGAFQRRVVLAALRMLEPGNGPVVIKDFSDDDPRATADPTWRPPFTPAAVAADPADSLAARMEAEILLLRGSHERWVAQHRRTTVGLSGLLIGDESATGAAIHVLREVLQARDDDRLKLIVANFMVPATRVRSRG